jgi:aminomethyltransferase
LAQKTAGLARRCVAFRMLEKSAPPRPHCPIWSPGPDAVQVGEVASGTQSPSLGLGIGMGYVPIPFAQPGQALEIEIRGNRSACVVVPKPIYHKPA